MSHQPELVAYYDGRFVPESEVRIPFRDASVTRGDGVYDTERTFDGRIFRLEDHLDRLWHSLELVRIDSPLEREEVAAITRDLASRNFEILRGDLWVTQRVSRGVSTSEGGDGRPSLIVECRALPFAERAHYFHDGVPLVIPSVRRIAPAALDPRAKTLNLLNFVLADLEARDTHVDAWAVLVNEQDEITEGAGANVFFVIDDILVTPPERDVLPGVTRAVVLELARAADIEVIERPVPRSETARATEAFITSTSLCICAAVSIDSMPMGNGSIPGTLTARLQRAFQDLVGVDFIGQYLAHLGELPGLPGR